MESFRRVWLKSCVKIYLCTNPEDSEEQRKALRETVFPRVRDYCLRILGLEFRVIDPYEGLGPQNPSDPRTQRLRLLQLEECRENSAGPFLVAVVGEDSGATCLPVKVEVSEFQKVMWMCQKIGIDTRVPERWYLRDENAIPASYFLLGHHHYPSDHGDQTSEEDGEMNEEEALQRMRTIFHTAVTRCIKEGVFTSETAQKYFSSAIETELRFALENRSMEDVARCLCYVQKIASMKHHRKSAEEPQPGPSGEPEQDASSRETPNYLHEQLLPELVASKQLLVYVSTYELRHDYSADARRRNADELCQQLHTDLLSLIDRSVARDDTTNFGDALSQDLLQQLDLCHLYSQLYKVKCAEAQDIKAYVEQRDTEYPLVLSGGPCTGKTVLLAHCASEVKTWLDGRNPVVAVYFINGNNHTLKQLLTSICYQMAVGYDHPWQNCLRTLSQLSDYFKNLLITTASLRPLVLIVDGLDQMEEAEEYHSILWLPKSLPANVKFLISTTPKKSGTLQALRAMYPKSPLFFKIGLKERKESTRLLNDLLLACNRRITSGQQVYINQALEKCSLMLYVELLHKQVCRWGSESEVSVDSLPNGVHDSIGRFLGQLEKEHGKVLLSRAMCYITAAKWGITEAELTDVLSSDDNVLSQYLPAVKCLPYKLRVPESAVEMILLDLRGFLMRRYVAGSCVLFWASRHFPLVIHKLYLQSAGTVQEVHSTLADYFSGRWAYGRAKPLIVGRDVVKQSRPQLPDMPTMNIYIDRQHPGQPWVFDSPTSSVPVRVNLRKILELPFHLKKSGRLEELGKTVMMSVEFHQAMLKAGHLDGLISELENCSLLVLRQELKLLACVLRDAACLLQGSPGDLEIVMQAKLFPFLDVLPGLKCYARQIYLKGLSSNGLNAVCSFTATVPSMRWMLSEVCASSVVEVLDAQCNMVILILDNSSIWAWNENTSGGFKLIHSSDLKFSSIKCTEHFVMLSTQCNRLLLFNVNAPSCISEIEVKPATPRSLTDPGTALNFEGFFVSESKILVWYKEANIISIVDVNTGVELSELHCQSRVSCVSSSSSGQLILCGQHNGTVSIFDAQDKRHLSSCSSTTGTLILLILHCEIEEVITCMDNIGSVFVWDIESVTKPKLRKMCCNTEDQEDVLNTEYSLENRALIVCKKHQILLWDTCEWTIEDKFRAPQDKTFIQAVLAKGCHFIIASLEDCPFLLVWKRSTGQCVLRLDVGYTQALKIVKLESNLLAVTANGIVTTWDLDLIWGASLFSKTGMKVKRILVDSAGGHFYTVDGTKLVWRWGTLSGKAVGCFQHENLVDNFALSKDGKHLVTASSRDVYVWQTNTGQNIHRIRGNLTSDLLITPNNKIVVSLCKHSLSRVWKIESGHVVCNVHQYLKSAVISPESTFILGLHVQDLLAVSLWSGCIGKRFSCSGQSDVVAFQPLLDHPDYVIVVTTSGSLYTWRVTEETICQHVQLPCNLLKPPHLFQVSTDGSYAVLSTAGTAVNILDIRNMRFCVLQAEGPVLLVCLDITGRYIVFICKAKTSSCDCDLHSLPVLNAVSVSNGKNVGRFYLCCFPSSLTLSEDLCAHVGFVDGSVGVYAVSDGVESNAIARSCLNELGQKGQCLCEEPELWTPLTTPSIVWTDSVSDIF